jgi:serine/threonine-protein kinase
MTPERYRQVGDLYHRALEIATDQRAAFLDQACASDEPLRRDVESLLALDRQAENFMEEPALEVAAEMLAAEQAHSIIGQSIGHYQIISLLDAGGMGEVYLARDSRLGRKVALKLLPPSFMKDGERVRRFKQEARAASALNHPNIITIYEIGEADDLHYIAAEFIEGQTLRKRLKGETMTLREALRIAIQVAGALESAHAAGVIHRDIKPENIMLRPDGLVKVLDFGLAKLAGRQSDTADVGPLADSVVKTDPGMVMGTIRYMAPEQARGLMVDAGADIFSLGVVLYEMIAARAPFEGATTADVMISLLTSEPPPLSHFNPKAPAELDRIVTRALKKDREDRYQRAADLELDLKEIERRLDDAQGEQRLGLSDRIRQLAVRRSAFLTAGLLFIALAAALSYILIPRGKPEIIKGININSIAVLPFRLQTPETDEYLSVGLADVLIMRLSAFKQITVRPTSAILGYKDHQPDPVAAGLQQKVDAVLEGSIHRSGERMRVTARLISVRDGMPLWSDQFDEKMSNLFVTEDNISQRLAGALAPNLGAEEKQSLVKHGTESAEAHQLYLKGRFFLNKGGIEGTMRALELFEQARKLDPNYALAYAGLADCYMMEHSGLPPPERKARMKAAAMKALEIDETLAEAQMSLAMVKSFYEWDWSGAEKEYERAIELNPNYARAHANHAYYLMVVNEKGWFEKAMAEFKRALELDPASLSINANLGWFYTTAGLHDQAIAQLHKTLEMDPSYSRAHLLLGVAYSFNGMHEQAIDESKQLVKLLGSGPTGKSVLGYVYARAGKRKEAMEILRELDELCEKNAYCEYDGMASIHASLRNKNRAFELIEKAIERKDPQITEIKACPYYNNLRSDPRFADVVRRIGLKP